MKKVLILGGGSGGAILANLLPKDEYDITLVDMNENHIFQPGYLWIAFKGERKERFIRPIRELIKPHINFVLDEVVGVDLEERIVRTRNKSIDYDLLVIATGARLRYDAVDGHEALLSEFGDFYSTPSNAEKLWRTLTRMRSGNFVIAVADPGHKCPPGPNKGAFLASELFSKRGLADKVKVVLALPYSHSYSSKTIAEAIEPELREKGIEVRTFFTVDSIDTENRKILSLEGEEIEYGAAVVIPVHEGPGYEIKPEEVKDDSNFVRIDKYTCQINGYDDAFAIGDCTNVPTSKSGVTAHIQAEVVSDRIRGYDSIYTGRTNCPLMTDGKALFVISDYENPPVPVRLSKFKRLMEDLFVATYWSTIKSPEIWQPIFRAYFTATDPSTIRSGGW